jgi:hypothetical protein
MLATWRRSLPVWLGGRRPGSRPIRRGGLRRGGSCEYEEAKGDLSLVRKLILCNPALRSEFDLTQKEFRLRDGSGLIRILSGRDIAGSHGKQYSFIGFDEVHNFRDWNLLEALQPDPTRIDALQWITSYDTIYNTPGVPLHDLKQIGKAGGDPRMLFSWYSGDLCTDPAFAGLPPEQRANPSMASWPEGAKYLEQQKRRLPTHKYRRLHLNLPGAPEGAFLDQGKVLAAIVPGRRKLPYESGRRYFAYNDMSGGSSDDATLCIGHVEGPTIVQDLLEKQAGGTPFNPRDAAYKFAGLLREYHVSAVWGDTYAGQTFVHDYRTHGVSYCSPVPPASEQYEMFEPILNAGEVELLDHDKQQEQLLTLVMRGSKITHAHGEHDDCANALAGMVWLVRSQTAVSVGSLVTPAILGRLQAMPRYNTAERRQSTFVLGERQAAMLQRSRGF